MNRREIKQTKKNLTMGKEWIFDNWFVRNYPRLRKVFGQYLNEDALHDAYLVMKCEVARSQVAPDKFEPYFFGVYKKCRQRCAYRDNRYFLPDEHFFLCMKEEETPSAEILIASDRLVYDILMFVKRKYPRTDYDLCRLKEYEAKCSYRDLSAYAGISASAVRRRISDITASIRNRRDFSSRYAYVNVM